MRGSLQTFSDTPLDGSSVCKRDLQQVGQELPKVMLGAATSAAPTDGVAAVWVIVEPRRGWRASGDGAHFGASVASADGAEKAAPPSGNRSGKPAASLMRLNLSTMAASIFTP